jgi:hypothetical protein
MVLVGSAVALLASFAGVIKLGSAFIIGDLAALAFAISLFTVICAAEAEG